MNTSTAPKPIQVTDRDALCKALSEEMCRVDAINYAVCYTCTEDADAASGPAVQKQNAKQLSMSIVKRVALRCPKYQWIRKTAQVTPRTIRNGFICALAEGESSKSTPKSCNGWLHVTLNRRVPGQLTVNVTLEHKFGHEHVGVSPLALGQRGLTQSILAPVRKEDTQPIRSASGNSTTGTTALTFVAPKQERAESIAKDILRALGRRPRTPEPFKQGSARPRKAVDENVLVAQTEAVKRGQVDLSAPVKVKSGAPRGRPRKKHVPVLTENRSLSNHGSVVIGTISSLKLQNQLVASGVTASVRM